MHVSFGRNARQDKPRAMRVRVYIDTYGHTRYEPQAKYLFRWLPNNGGTTRKPSSLMWSLGHGMGYAVNDLIFVEEGKAKANLPVLLEQERKLAQFPWGVK